MGLFDKLSGAVGAFKENMAQEMEKQAKIKAEKKEAEDRARQEALGELNANLEKIRENAGPEHIFSYCDGDKLIAFSREYYEKIRLPASTEVTLGLLSFGSYIDPGSLKKLQKTYASGMAEGEIPIVCYNATPDVGFVLTNANLYFSGKVSEASDEKLSGRIPLKDISSFDAAIGFNTVDFITINGVRLFSVNSLKEQAARFQSPSLINGFLERIKDNDFDISDKEISDAIVKRLDEKIYGYVKAYLHDDEHMVFFAWGLNSITAKDYVVCTTHRMLMVDREMLGLRQDIRAFDYEDINSISSAKTKTNTNDFWGEVLLGAMTTLFKQSDLEINVAGSVILIKTLTRVEVEHVIKIVNDRKRMIKRELTQPKFVQVQPAEPAGTDILAQIEKLAELQSKGILTEEEFASKKASLLSKL